MELFNHSHSHIIKVIFNHITIIIFIHLLNYINCASNIHRGSDICSHWNGRRHFLELGERGELHAFNVSASAIRTSIYNPSLNLMNRTTNKLDIWYQCNLELVTCAECVIRITFTYINFTKTCDRPINQPAINIGNNNDINNPGRNINNLNNNKNNNNNNNNNNDVLQSSSTATGSSSSSSSTSSISSTNCPCEQIHFSEPPYDPSISGQYYCGDGKVFRSKTRTLLLKFFYRALHSHIFSLQYFSERNVRIISGSPKQSIVRNYSQIVPQVISTPYFPVPYPRDYSIEHILTCETDNCRVRLDFTDFQLGLTSKMEVFDSNGQMLDSYTGEHFRPPILVSTGKSLLIQFRGNGVTGYGFRVEVTFISEKQLDEKETIPYTDCGGMVTGMGGAITMMNMIENTTEVRYYDCIWLIKPSSNYMVMKTHISLRVDTLHGMASKSELVIRQGITSDSQELEAVSWPNKGMSKKNHIVPVLTGYYIRLKGVFGISSRLAIVYSIFNYMNCYIGSEFLCQNNHCISIRLHCDGFDHCGDGSDEPDTCNDEWAQRTANRGWYSHKPNYYFPKNEEYTDLKAATGIFILSSLGVLVVISMWMIVLYKIGIRARNQRDLQNHLQTISELLDRQDETIPIDEPPVYEAPPDYEEVIKIGMEEQIRASSSSSARCNHPRRHHERRRHRDRNSSTSSRSHSASSISSVNPNRCNNNFLTVPSSSTSRGEPPEIYTENLQEIADRVLQATAACDITETNTRTIRQQLWKDQSVQTGSISSYTSIPIWSQLPGPSGQQNNSNYSIGTVTQFEESSAEFRDQSFDLSLSLAITPTLNDTSTEKSEQQRPQSSIYPGNDQQKSIIILNTGETFIKQKKLRHTFSTPETWLFSSICAQDKNNYGSNLHVDRNSFISKTSTFCSDLPKDESDPSQHKDISSSSSCSIPIITSPQISSEYESCANNYLNNQSQQYQNHQQQSHHYQSQQEHLQHQQHQHQQQQQQYNFPQCDIASSSSPSSTTTAGAAATAVLLLNEEFSSFQYYKDDNLPVHPNTILPPSLSTLSYFENLNRLFMDKKQNRRIDSTSSLAAATTSSSIQSKHELETTIRKRSLRSKSFNQNNYDKRNHIKSVHLQRSSSFDLLLLIPNSSNSMQLNSAK